eukprot:m.133334 g.133334  ORF g.133334 m.133334 type:complete len:180 (-) comp13943_c0_seq3:969-1508(-)
MATLKRKLKATMLRETQCELDVKSATSNERCKATPQLLASISHYARSEIYRPLVFRIISKRLQDKGSLWLHPYKSLLVLQHLLSIEDVEIRQQVLDLRSFIAHLLSFEYREKSVDYGVEGESGGCVCVEAPVGKHLLLTYVCHVYLGECGHANLEYNGIHAISISFSPLTTMLLLLGLC